MFIKQLYRVVSLVSYCYIENIYIRIHCGIRHTLQQWHVYSVCEVLTLFFTRLACSCRCVLMTSSPSSLQLASTGADCQWRCIATWSCCIPLESSLREQCVGVSGERLARDVTWLSESRDPTVTTNRRLCAIHLLEAGRRSNAATLTGISAK